MTRMKTPPVLSVQVEDDVDVMIARDTARRAAALLGFAPSHKARLGAAVAALAEIILEAGAEGTIHLSGVRNGWRVGMQVSCEAAWLQVLPVGAIGELQDKLSKMMDEVEVIGRDPPTVSMLFWLLPPGQVEE